MDAHQIRVKFLDFFEERGHVVTPSASLVPVDPTLLLTVAGMVPFKSYLLGEEPPPYPRAASVQKSFRTEDIELIGTTVKHLTFFEMLGNFSFGDYFKEKAIPWAYEFVTEHLEIDSERLWFTVYKDDEEAEQIWVDDVGVPAERVQRLDRDNFWQMGVPGPCGPSSEIFFDLGEAHGPGGGPAQDEDRYVEIWNLVFMQNIQDEPYHVVGNLPAKNIDTGAGLERLAMVLQQAASAFETDLVRPVLATGERVTGQTYGAGERSDVALRILADHGRAITFLMGDGVVPSNQGRGYVLRRMLRRAVRHAWSLGSKDLAVPELAEATIGVMQEAYPELREQRDLILSTGEREEVAFRRTLESGHAILEDELETLGGDADVPGDTAFRLHDTYGFPIELTREIAAERGLRVAIDEFETLMEEQRKRARAAWRGADTAAGAEFYRKILDDTGPTEFVGYELEEADARILSIIVDGDPVDRANSGQDAEIFLDRTPFYAESGGQIGDSGELRSETGTLRVADTQFSLPTLHGHRAKVESGFVQVGQEVSAVIHADRRERIRKSHTGTHLLHWALRDVLGKHVHQAGSLVDAGRLRFDFSHHAAVEPDELLGIERAANEKVIENARVRAFETTKEEAVRLGALAFFGDKYGDRVRVVEAGEYSREFCGGTHVPTTGQTGPVVLLSESSIGSNLRRLEALTGSAAYEHLSRLRGRLDDAARVLRARPEDLVEAAEALAIRVRDQEQRLAAFADRDRSDRARALADQADQVGDRMLLVAAEEGLTPDELRALAIQVRDRLRRGVVVLGSQRDGKGSLVGAVTPDLAGEGLSAADVIASAARLLGGGSSKDPELAQAGGRHGERLDDALAEARAVARRALSEE